MKLECWILFSLTVTRKPPPVIRGLYYSKIKIIVSRCQKQAGGKDCGLYAIAFAVTLVFNLHPSKLKFNQQKMRSHLKARDDTISMQVNIL